MLRVFYFFKQKKDGSSEKVAGEDVNCVGENADGSANNS
jgi:hypothetical protein